MDVKKLLNSAGATLGRIIQQAEEAFLDIPRTEYSTQYKENIRKVDFLIVLTEKMITDFERFLETNSASSGEVKLIDNVVDPVDRFTYLEEFGVILQHPLEEIKLYCPLFDKNLLKVGKYQIKLGEAFKAYIKNEGEIYIKKLRKMLEIDLKHFKDEETNLENLRLDHDYLKSRMDNAYTQLGRDALVKEYEKVKNNFEFYLEKTTELFKTIDSYFTTHRILLKEFVEIQRNYYRDCDRYLTTLLRKMYTDSYKITCDTQLDQYTNGVISTSDVDEIIKRENYLEKTKLSKYKENVDNRNERIVSIMKNGVMLIHFRRDDRLISINETDRSSSSSFRQNFNFSAEEKISPENGIYMNGTHNENNIQIKSNLMSTEQKVHSAAFENDAFGKVNLKLNTEISQEEPKPLSVVDGEIMTPQILTSENTAIQINDENTIATDFNSELSCKIESNQNNIKTNISEVSLSSSIDLNNQSNGNLENVGEFKESVETEPVMVSVSTNLENLIPDSSDLNVDMESELNLDIHTGLYPKLSDDLIQPDINTNLENTTPELSINIQNDLELKQDMNFDETLELEEKISDEPLTIDNVLNNTISEINLSLNITSTDAEKLDDKLPEHSIQLDVNLNHEATSTDLSMNIPTDTLLNENLNINQTEKIDGYISTESTKTLLQDTLDIKNDTIQPEADKLEADISLGSITSVANIKVAINFPDLSLNIQAPLTEEINVIQEDLSLRETPNIDINQNKEDTTSNLSMNINADVDVKVGLDEKELQISDENSSLDKIKSDLTENIEISESIKEHTVTKSEIDIDISTVPIKSEIIPDNENTGAEVKVEGGLALKTEITTPNISSTNDNNTVEKISEIENENSAKSEDLLFIKTDMENTDLTTNLQDKDIKVVLDTNINIETDKVEIENSLNSKTEIDINPEKSVEESVKIEETAKYEKDQNINANIITESPAQLDSQLEIREPEKEISETPKETNIIIESPVQQDSQPEIKEPKKEISETPKETNIIIESPVQQDLQLDIKEPEKEISETPKETNITIESPVQLNSQPEIKEPKKEISETPKENENNDKIETKSNDDETEVGRTLKLDQNETESDKINNQEEK